MNWLLKIVEGPMKGAEIALVVGTRVTLGKDDACDIVIADASLADEALSLDVADGGVTLVRADGSGVAMRPFEVHAVGTTSLAVGPAEGTWEELRPAPVETPVEETPAEETPSEPVDATSPSRQEDEATTTSDDDATGTSRPRKRGFLVVGIVLLLVIIAALVAFWWLRGSSSDSGESSASADTAQVSVKAALETLAHEHGLRLSVTNGFARLTGNLKRRTERQALRALALAADRYCRLDLSDDESFKSAAEALLFTVTEDAVKVGSATNRLIALKGYAPDAVALERLLAAMREDIPWLEDTDTKDMTLGGPVPEELSKSRFATTGELASAPAAAPVVRPVVPPLTNVVTVVVTNAAPVVKNAVPAVTNRTSAVAKEPVVAREPEEQMLPEDRMAAALVAQAEQTGGLLPRGMLPVAGILTKPYLCVVLSNGHRMVEGTKISGLEIVRIEAARIVLGFREKRVRWEP